MFRQLNPQFPAVHHRSVETFDGVVGVPLVEIADESEATALLGVGVTGYVDVPHLAVSLEHSLERLRGRPVGQVVDLQRNHSLDLRRTPSSVAHHEIYDKNRIKFSKKSDHFNATQCLSLMQHGRPTLA